MLSFNGKVRFLKSASRFLANVFCKFGLGFFVRLFFSGKGLGLQSHFFSVRFGKRAGYPTKHAPDAGDSAQISSSFLRLSIFPVGRRSAARPSAGNANRWAALDLTILRLKGSV